MKSVRIITARNSGTDLGQQAAVCGALYKLQDNITAGSTASLRGGAISVNLAPVWTVSHGLYMAVANRTHGSSAERWPRTVPSARVIAARPWVVPAEAAACLAAMRIDIELSILYQIKKQEESNEPRAGVGTLLTGAIGPRLRRRRSAFVCLIGRFAASTQVVVMRMAAKKARREIIERVCCIVECGWGLRMR